MRRAFLAVAASLVAIGGLSAIPAGATAPGKNGDIAFRRFIDDVGVLFTIHPDGTGERRVLTPPEGSTDDFPDFASDGSLIAFQRCAETSARPWSCDRMAADCAVWARTTTTPTSRSRLMSAASPSPAAHGVVDDDDRRARRHLHRAAVGRRRCGG